MMQFKKILYNFIDLVTLHRGINRRINGIPIRFPPRWSRYFEEDYEKENVLFFREHASHIRIIIDIGSHLGVMSVTMAKLAGPKSTLYCFEPTPATYRIFREVIELNHLEDRIIPFPDAVSDRPGQVEFYVTDIEGHNSNTLIKYRNGSGNETPVTVNTISVDEFKLHKNISKIDFLKIDAEGAEMKVLRGARKTFLKDRPFAILALHPIAIASAGDTLPAIWDLLTEYRYAVYLHSSLMSKDSFCHSTDLFDVHLTPL